MTWSSIFSNSASSPDLSRRGKSPNVAEHSRRDKAGNEQIRGTSLGQINVSFITQTKGLHVDKKKRAGKRKKPRCWKPRRQHFKKKITHIGTIVYTTKQLIVDKRDLVSQRYMDKKKNADATGDLDMSVGTEGNMVGRRSRPRGSFKLDDNLVNVMVILRESGSPGVCLG